MDLTSFPPWAQWVLKRMPQLALLFAVPLAVLSAELSKGISNKSLGEIAGTVLVVLGLSALILFLLHVIKNKKDAGIKITPQIQVLLWFVVVATIACGTFAIGSAWFDWPRKWSSTPASASSAAREPAPSVQPELADVRFILSGASDPAFWVYNAGNAAANEPSYELELYNLSQVEPSDPRKSLALRIPPGAIKHIPPGRCDGPHSLKTASSQARSLRSGDIVFGSAQVKCATCYKAAYYWLYLTIDGRAWSQLISDPASPHVREILDAAVSDRDSFDPDRWLPLEHRVPAAQYSVASGWAWTDESGAKIALTSSTPLYHGWKTWTGNAWRDYLSGDELAPNAIALPRLEGAGSIDPTIPVITKASEIEKVMRAHATFATPGASGGYEGTAAAGSADPHKEKAAGSGATSGSGV